MKFKITIPAQSIKIEIPAQEIEMDFQPIWEIDPPIIPEPPIEPEPPIQEVFDLDEYMAGKSGLVYLPSEFHNKEVVVKSKGYQKLSKSVVFVGKNTILTFENWDVTPDQIIDCEGSEEVAFVGITFAGPPNRPICTAFPNKSVFGWERDSVRRGRFAYVNNQQLDKERVTFGLSYFVYSSEGDEIIYLIAKNIWHNGFVFTQAKNPYTGNLRMVWHGLNVHNPIIEGPQSHYYTPTRIMVRIMVQGGVAKIISDNQFSQIRQGQGYNYGNQRSILHFDRYVYDISERFLVDDKTLIIDRIDEYHPNDNIAGIGKVLTKQIDDTRRCNWIYTYESNDLPEKITLPEGEFDAYIVYKGNASFHIPVDINTKFGPDYWESGHITQSQGYGWSAYNEELFEDWEDVNMDGFYWKSGGSGITREGNIKNVRIQAGYQPEDKRGIPLPEDISTWINWLSGLDNPTE